MMGHKVMISMFRPWLADDRASIAVEGALLLPLLLTVFLGIMDAGQGVLVSQKVITATHMVGDLIGRENSLSDEELNNIIEAGKFAIVPYSADNFGVDIVGIRFDGGPNHPEEVWRTTVNMSSNRDMVSRATGLGNDQEGAVGVRVEYSYTPYFSYVLTGAFTISETTYTRGRSGAFIPRE